jgi:phage terminase small subunit
MNARQRRFVDEYLVSLNATKAAIAAGYSEKTARSLGQRLLTNADISAAIATGQAEISKRTEVTVDYVVKNLVEVVERCSQRAPVMVREGRHMVQLVDEDDRHVWQFDSKGVIGACNLLGKHLGIFIEKREITIPQGAGVLAVPLPIGADQWAAGVAAQQEALTKRPAETEQ